VWDQAIEFQQLLPPDVSYRFASWD